LIQFKSQWLEQRFDIFSTEVENYIPMGFKYPEVPGNGHKIKVNDIFFRTVQQGEKILLERNCPW
jgi:hypothetical protein